MAELGRWLMDHGVGTVAMEATGVYWKPVYYALEGLFPEVWLCNAHHVKNVPGRKTDMADCEWLADVAAHGMVRPSFVPPPPIRELRELTRYRKTQVDARGQEIQRLEKVLQDAGVKLSSVASKVLTRSGRAMVEALIAGERDPGRLADLAKGRMRPKIPALAEALEGRFGPHHAVVARQILAHIDFLDASIDALSTEIAERLRPFEAAKALLKGIPGWADTVAEVFLAEAGPDMSVFPTAAHLAAWVGVAPANRESAGRHRPAGTRHGVRWLRRCVVESVHSVSRSDNYLGAQYRQIARRRGPNKAVMAVAHSMIVIAWHVLSTGQTYEDLGADYFRKRQDPARTAKRLTAQLEQLGYRVVLTPVAA